MPHIGPYSSNAILSKPDGRTKEARLVASLRSELIAHVGGSPTVAERMMIDQACELQLRIAKMNREFMRDGEHADGDSQTFLGLNDSLTGLLRILSNKVPDRDPPTRERTASSISMVAA
jgi:hypothetical protein